MSISDDDSPQANLVNALLEAQETVVATTGIRKQLIDAGFVESVAQQVAVLVTLKTLGVAVSFQGGGCVCEYE